MSSRSVNRALAALARACLESDNVKAAALCEAAGHAFVDCVREQWGERLRAADVLLDAAAAALDRGEAARDPDERRRQLQLFELCMSAAGAEPAVTG
jgi:hypothetical protein